MTNEFLIHNFLLLIIFLFFLTPLVILIVREVGMFENLLSKWSWECILAICLDNRWVRVALSSKQFSWWYHWPRGSTVEQLVENDDQPIAVTPSSSQGSQRPHQLPRWPTRVTWQKARSQHMQVKILCWACCFDCYDCRESWVTLGIFLRRKMSNRAGQGWGWVMKGQGSKLALDDLSTLKNHCWRVGTDVCVLKLSFKFLGSPWDWDEEK